MSKQPLKPFSNPKLKDDLKDTTSATLVIQLYTQMILQQPDIKLNALPDLPNHQKTARENAKLWNEKILPNMSKTTADIIGYANMFKNFHGILVKYAKDVANPDSRKKLVEGLKLLHDQIKKKSDATQAVIDQLVSFHAALTKDNQNFKGDYNIALVKIEGDDGEIKALGKQLDAVQSAMNKDIGMMAGGAVAIVGGIAMMAVGFMLELPTLGASTALVGGGYFLMVGGVVVETIGALDYSDRMKEQKRLTEKLEGDKQEMAALKSVKGSLENFLSAISTAISAAQALVGAWMGLGADLKIVIDAIDHVDPSISSEYIVANLNTANDDWQVALEKAKQLQPTGQVPVKFYKNLQDVFDEAKPQG